MMFQLFIKESCQIGVGDGLFAASDIEEGEAFGRSSLEHLFIQNAFFSKSYINYVQG
jgi:hypothetical protein